MQNKKFVAKTISSLNKKLFDKKDKFYNLHYNFANKKIDTLRTTFVEAHCIHCLNELGYKKQSREILSSILESKLFDKGSNLFRFSMKNNKLVNPDKNGCSNMLMILNLAKQGFKEDAEKIMKELFKTLFNKSKGLFGRSSRDKDHFVLQTNLWAYISLKSLGHKKEANNLLRNIIKNFYSKKDGCFLSKSSTMTGKHKFSFIFSDDNFLFCHVAKEKQPRLCKTIAKEVLKNSLYDSSSGLFNRSLRMEDSSLNTDKSVYKNSICLLGLKSLGDEFVKEAKSLEEAMIENLYDKKAKLFFDCFSDSNLLACWAISK